ncbi:5'/3'-nucleotidase SurE [Zavarzinia compransoris]|uniref:5'/3'-nucleotidase SurE n=1 Tax=Zavarzinia marina TaxID=2911065 RepID=UPI001F4338C1|nr:5'/3'-nucleotidase SurE [Zavarzinia marina]MCF4164433.1 5'/3'-nucleotidase SurE [Zavarzinia marina]
MVDGAKDRPLRILVSNDDGIHAPGLKVLIRIAKAISTDVWVVAPETEQSGASHSLTLTSPLRIRKAGAKRYAVSGTPTDCVMMAIDRLIKGRKPDLVLSGVNRGGNIGEDVTYSGTIAAAMEGTMLGVPSIAMSQVLGFDRDKPVQWACAAAHGAAVVRRLLETGWPDDVLINVNFPPIAPEEVTGVRVSHQGRRGVGNLFVEERVDARGNDYYWLGYRRSPEPPEVDSDIEAVYAGAISVTALHLDLTHYDTQANLRRAFSGLDLGS